MWRRGNTGRDFLDKHMEAPLAAEWRREPCTKG
jgi:hypothetical protein